MHKAVDTQFSQWEIEEILDNSSDGIFVTDCNGVIQYLNQTSRMFIGIGDLNVIGRNVSELEEMGFFTDSAIKRVIATKRQVTIVQKSKYDILVTAKPLLDLNGEIKRIVCNSRDMSEITKLEDELERVKLLADHYHDVLKRMDQKEAVLSKIVCNSDEMQAVLDSLMKISEFDTSILFLGESGVGKSVFAKLVHQLSHRAKGDFVAINCGAIPENLLESELFGYSEGAFSGAKRSGKTGMVEMANGGTLFLDEIAELPIQLQTKLLHVLSEKKITRVGSNKVIDVDFRLLTATNKDLAQMVKNGKFREDLYYRLNVIKITIPPLRKRREEIPFLINFYLDEFNSKYGLNKQIEYDAYLLLESYDYPGNVRELINMVEHLYVLSSQYIITREQVEKLLLTERADPQGAAAQAQESAGPQDCPPKPGTYDEMLSEFEEKLFTGLYQQYPSSYTISRILGISQSTASRKIRKYCQSRRTRLSSGKQTGMGETESSL